MKKVLLTATLLLSTTSVMFAENTPTIFGNNGERFSVQPVSGDGDCAFTAIGKTRSDVVSALRDAVEENYAVYGNFDASRASLHNLVASLTLNSPVSTITNALNQVEGFISTSAAHYASDPDYRSPSKLAETALSEFRSGLGSFSEESFASAKRMLQSRILNMYYERYEAFQTALKQELMDSGLSAAKLTSKAELSQSIADVFAKNNGKSSWLPMGLMFGIQERLGLNLAVWSSRDQTPGYVKLYQFAAPGGDITDPSVLHVVWNGSHFDKLTVIQP